MNGLPIFLSWTCCQTTLPLLSSEIDVPVWGEISVTVDLLKGELAGTGLTEDQAPQVAERWAIWRAEKQ